MEAGIKTWMRSKLIQNAQVFSILPRSRWVMLRRLVSRCHKKFQMTHFVFCSTLPRPQIKNSNWKRTQKHMSNFMIKLFFFSLYFWIWYWTYLSSTFNPNGSLIKNWTKITEKLVKRLSLAFTEGVKAWGKFYQKVSSGLFSHLPLKELCLLTRLIQGFPSAFI